MDAAEALVRSLKLKSVISAGKRMGQPATLHADAPNQVRLDAIESLIFCGTLSSLEKAAQLMEQDAERSVGGPDRPTVWLEELKSRTVQKILSMLEHGLVEEDLTRAMGLLAKLCGDGFRTDRRRLG